ncbi:HupE/UreJ family protein [Cryptosporangium aurantiacum]|uniref:HupE / UreJ protein n=1 Tax=Cryptosporangium aurantiacum TaxID=134849 RepID=A0A1M7Q7X5_9ACTN|nr:HupE/UreJ family protein [Cryptosporangium aurantiacum]SHN26524.1 HupE / UreJ protein [Cryptosporangium aurantiacum]
MGRRIGVGAFLAAGALLAVPGTASAHGITGTGPSVASFLRAGFEHMLLGWDHLLFVAGVLILAGEVRRAVALISLFALGHSTTLVVAALAGWRVDALLVDVVIALSVVFVGVAGLLGGPRRWRWFAAVVFGFGLIHGLGLATRLQELGLPRDGLLARVLLFNVGVEAGQLVAIIGVLVLAGVAGRRPARWAPRWRLTSAGPGAAQPGPGAGAAQPAGWRPIGWRPVGQVGLVAAGLIAVWLIAVSWVDQRNAGAAFAASGCRMGDRSELLWAAPAAAVPKRFYGPDETAPDDALAYVVAEGYVVVEYSPRLTDRQVGRLREFITARDRIAAGAAEGQTEPLKAVTSYGTLTCPRFDLAALGYFVDRWSADPRSRPYQ